MRRLARRLLTLCSAVSLLLFVAVCVLWAWPHAAGRAVRLNEGKYHTGEYQTWIARDRGGRFVLQVFPYAFGYPLPSDSAPEIGSYVVVLPSEHLPFPGLGWVDRVMPLTGRITSRRVTVACWLPALMFAVLPTVWLVRHRRQTSRSRVGFCASCGYDLRASPERCPECGAAAGTPSSIR